MIIIKILLIKNMSDQSKKNLKDADDEESSSLSNFFFIGKLGAQF